jgi:hypothetical protein
MFKLPVEQYIRTIRDLVLTDKELTFNTDGSYSCMGVELRLDFQVYDYDSFDEKTGRFPARHQGVSIILCRNTTVFMADVNGTAVGPYENISNHDSCWIDAIHCEVTTRYFRMCSQVNDDVAPRTLESSASVDRFRIPQKVRVTYVADDSNKKLSGARKLISALNLSF